MKFDSTFTFEKLFDVKLVWQRLFEKLNFDTLFALSEPKRVLRSRTVRGPALDVEAYKDKMIYHFNAKSFPSTTGRRHRAAITFFKPENRDTPLEKVPVEVDCDCEDFKFRFAWAIAQRGSSRTGSQSLNKSNGKAPKITNPSGRPSLCKHLLAMRNFLYGQDSRFIPTDDTDDSHGRLNQLVARANGRTIDSQGRPTSPPPPAQPTPSRPISRTYRAPATPPSEPEVADIPPELPEEPAPRTNPRNPTNPRNR